jgi:hypothetical protein
MNCLRACPVEAVRVRNRKARMLEDRCIDCGECLKVCKSGAIIPLTNTFHEFSRFKYTVAIPSIALYSQFGIKVKPKTILAALKIIGFDEVIDITKACLSVAKGLENYISNYSGERPLLSSFCSTCVKLIQTKYPELIKNLVPIISPIELAVINVKKNISKRTGLTEAEIGVIYITPCPSKMIQISQKQGLYAEYDGVLPINDIYNTLYAVIHQIMKKGEPDIGYFNIEGFGLNYVHLGGLLTMIDNENSIAVAGITDVVKILEDIEKGKLRHVDFVELHACPEACLGGSMVVDNIYLARTKIIRLIDEIGSKRPSVGWKDDYAGINLFYTNIYEPMYSISSEIDIGKAILKVSERQEILSRLPKINCAACGSPSCESFADDLVNGEVTHEDCVFIQIEELKHKLKDKIIETLDLQNQLNEHEAI